MESNIIYLKMAEAEMTDEEQAVIRYTKEFLNSNKKEIMEHCFESIRDCNNERCFKDEIKVIDDHSFDLLFPLVSNVILTANKVECDSLNYFATKQRGNNLRRRQHYLKIIPNYNVGVADTYIFKFGKYFMLHINAYETGSNTPGGSSDVVRFISRHPTLNPSSIISFGVCYGRNPFEQDIGDVIIPQKLYPWSIGQKIVDKQLTIKHDNFNLWLFDLFNNSDIYPVLKDFCNGDDGKTVRGCVKLKDGKTYKKYTFNVKTTMGNISTGEAVVSSQEAKRIIRDSTNNFKELGGEMEGYGIAKECVYYSRIPCFIIKSICDWGILKNITTYLSNENEKCEFPNYLKDKLQSYACFCAGIVLFELMKQDKLTTLKLYDDINKNVSGNKFLNGIKYFTQQEIVDWIRKYYKIEKKYATEIFNMLIDRQFIIKTNNKEILYKYNLK